MSLAIYRELNDYFNETADDFKPNPSQNQPRVLIVSGDYVTKWQYMNTAMMIQIKKRTKLNRKKWIK